MKSRALRVTVLTLFVGLLAGAGYVFWLEESRARLTAAAARAFDDHIRDLSHTLLAIKSAQPGYVAAGQGDDFWAARVDSLLGDARTSLGRLTGQAQGTPARQHIAGAAEMFADFEQMDRRAREYARNGQRLLASDLIFSDGIEKLDGAVASLANARSEELASSERDAQDRRRTQLMTAGGAAALSLLVAALLVPLPRSSSDPSADAARAVEPEPVGRVTADTLSIRPAAEAVPVVKVEAPPPPVAAPAPAPAVNLDRVAALCTELARLLDNRGVPTALEHAAAVLDASGVVVWVADPDGRELVPIMAHGYPAAVVARLGTIAKDAENVTAAAFRTGLLQTVKSDGISPGAIAAPLITPAGPVGVMAAEVLHDGERSGTTRAVAAIVAAQLATLVGPPSRSTAKPEAAGAGA